MANLPVPSQECVDTADQFERHAGGEVGQHAGLDAAAQAAGEHGDDAARASARQDV